MVANRKIQVYKARNATKLASAYWNVTVEGVLVGMVEKRRASVGQSGDYWAVFLNAARNKSVPAGYFDPCPEGLAMAVAAIVDGWNQQVD